MGSQMVLTIEIMCLFRLGGIHGDVCVNMIRFGQDE